MSPSKRSRKGRTSRRRSGEKNSSGMEEKVIELYEKGVPVKEIMRVVGLRSCEVVYRILRSRGVRRREKSRHKKLGGNVIEEIRRRFEKGDSIYRLAKEYGLSTSRVYYIVRGKKS